MTDVTTNIRLQGDTSALEASMKRVAKGITEVQRINMQNGKVMGNTITTTTKAWDGQRQVITKNTEVLKKHNGVMGTAIQQAKALVVAWLSYKALGFIVDLFKQSANAALEAQTAVENLNTALNSIGSAKYSVEINAFAESFARLYNFDDEDVRNLIADFAKLSQIGGTALAPLIESMYQWREIAKGTISDVTQLEKGFNNFIKTGNAGSLKRIGIIIDKNTLKSLDTVEKRIKYLEDEAKRRGGPALLEAQANTPQAVMRGYALAMSELREAIGNILLSKGGIDIIKSITKQIFRLTDYLSKPENVAGITRFVDKVGDFIEKMLDFLGKTGPSWKGYDFPNPDQKQKRQYIPGPGGVPVPKDPTAGEQFGYGVGTAILGGSLFYTIRKILNIDNNTSRIIKQTVEETLKKGGGGGTSVGGIMPISPYEAAKMFHKAGMQVLGIKTEAEFDAKVRELDAEQARKREEWKKKWNATLSDVKSNASSMWKTISGAGVTFGGAIKKFFDDILSYISNAKGAWASFIAGLRGTKLPGISGPGINIDYVTGKQNTPFKQQTGNGLPALYQRNWKPGQQMGSEAWELISQGMAQSGGGYLASTVNGGDQIPFTETSMYTVMQERKTELARLDLMYKYNLIKLEDLQAQKNDIQNNYIAGLIDMIVNPASTKEEISHAQFLLSSLPPDLTRGAGLLTGSGDVNTPGTAEYEATKHKANFKWAYPQYRDKPEFETNAEKNARRRQNMYSIAAPAVEAAASGGGIMDIIGAGGSAYLATLGGPWALIGSAVLSIATSIFGKERKPLETKETYNVRVVNPEDLAMEMLRTTQVFRAQQSGGGVDSFHNSIQTGAIQLGYG